MADSAPPTKDRAQIIACNQKIAQHANRKELVHARELFDSAVESKTANMHTYAAMVNAAVRCGNMDIADEVVKIMRANGFKAKDIVLYTTLMKGHCAAGKLSKAFELLFELIKKQPIVAPNIRTINTLLRGCVQSGTVLVAEKLIQLAQQELKIPLDVSSWEYLMTLLSQNLALDKLLPIIGRLKSDASMQSGLAAMFVHIARAATLLGDYKSAKKFLNEASNIMSQVGEKAPEQQPEEEEIANKVATLMETADNPATTTANTGLTNAKKTVSGGKKAWKSSSENATLSVDERRNESLQIYQLHIVEERKQEIELLQKFIAEHTLDQANTFQAFDYLISYYHRLLSFDFDHTLALCDSVLSAGTAAAAAAKSKQKQKKKDKKAAAIAVVTVDGVVNEEAKVTEAKEAVKVSEETAIQVQHDELVWNALIQKFGLDTYCKRLCNKTTAQLLGAPGKEEPSANEAMLREKIQSLRARMAAYFTTTGHLQPQNIFQTTNDVPSSSSSSTNAKPLLKVEICSGAGEWAVTQASQDPNNHWMTLEIRQDRVYQTFLRSLYAGITNLCVVGGNAREVLPTYFQSGQIDHIFVNHPEPPQQTGAKEDSEAQHLLNESFLREMDRALSQTGLCTIVTDNLWYGKVLTKILAGMPSLKMKSLTTLSDLRDANNWQVQFEYENVVLWQGIPGIKAGHVVADASSYFDRLWKRSQLSERYFIVLTKQTTGSSTLKTTVQPAGKKMYFGNLDGDDAATNANETTSSEVITKLSSDIEPKKSSKEAEQKNDKNLETKKNNKKRKGPGGGGDEDKNAMKHAKDNKNKNKSAQKDHNENHKKKKAKNN